MPLSHTHITMEIMEEVMTQLGVTCYKSEQIVVTVVIIYKFALYLFRSEDKIIHGSLHYCEMFNFDTEYTPCAEIVRQLGRNICMVEL